MKPSSVTLRISPPHSTVYVPPLSMPGALITTEEYVFSGVNEARTAPLPSVTLTAAPPLCAGESRSSITPCVSEERLCAMPDEPAAMSVPPVIVPVPA